MRWLTGRAPGIAIGPVYSNYILMRDASSVSALAKQMHRKAAEVRARFRVPQGGGRATGPSWSEQRLVRLSAGWKKGTQLVLEAVSPFCRPPAT